LKRSSRRFFKKTNSLFLQLLFVTLAFALMVVSSGIFVNNMVRTYLKRDAESILTQTQIKIEDELREPATLMISITKDVRDIILKGGSALDVQVYYDELAVELLEKETGFHFDGLHGYFEALDNIYIPAPGWIPPEGFDAKERPWYGSAVEGNGKIVISPMFLSLRTGEYIITFACRIFDYEGQPLGTVAMNVPIHNIAETATRARITRSGYGFLANETFEIVAHPTSDFITMNMRDCGPGFLKMVEFFEQGITSVSELEERNYRNVHTIFYCRQIENGWYLGIMTPKEEYYRSFSILVLFLSCLSIVLVSFMYIILIRIDKSRNRADKAYREHLENILNGMDAMIYVTEPDTGVILFMNDSMKQHYKIKGDSVGLLCYKVLQEGLNERCDFCPCHQLDKNPDKTIVWEEHSTLTNRIYRNVDRYISWPNRKDVHMQYSVDITELVAAKVAAEQSNRSKGIFLAQMSHEIRTPMNAILGISEIQLRDSSLSPDAEEGYKKIYESGNLLLNIINDILDFSKIEAGKMEISPDVYDIPSLLNDSVLVNRLRFESKPIEFNLKVDNNTPLQLIGDELRIRQILNNLLSNAFKYTDEGEVGLSIAVESKNDDDNVMLVFIVSDTGQGMDITQIERLFDEYTRFNLETNRSVSGTGLGMNITKRLVDLMNGELSVTSQVGKGTVFTVRLPQKSCGSVVCGSEVIERLRNFTFNSSSITKKVQILHEYMPYGRVLVVDDVESNLYVAKGMLFPYGMFIDTANSGFKAIEMIKNNPRYDIVFMDHMMPKMDGIQTTKIIRDSGYTGRIVALTANAVVGQAEMFLSNGFDDFIAKPIDSRKLDLILKLYVRDIQPPEVIEAARRQVDQRQPFTRGDTITNQGKRAKSDFLKVIRNDVEKALSVLEDILPKIKYAGNDDLKLFTTTVHGMKSVLLNIDETELSAIALKLEKAGNSGNIEEIIAETPSFISSLKLVMDKHKPKAQEVADDISDDDKIFLKEKLLEIKTACELFQKRSAKTALEELRQKTWPNAVNAQLEEISMCLLHGEFKKIAVAIENSIKMYNY